MSDQSTLINNQKNQLIQADYSKGFKISIFLLRVAIGWLFFYSGLTKVLNRSWSAAGYLTNAKTFSFFYNWLADPAVLPIVNFLNKWGLLLVGFSLIFGIFSRFSSLMGILLMILYYFPVLQFPYLNLRYFIVDDHIIYALVFLVFIFIKPGRFFGLEGQQVSLSICKKIFRIKN